jgi:hypothetical protein
MPRNITSDPEVYDLCLELRADKGWNYPRIAEYLFHKKGIAHPEDPSKPVHRSTIMRWVAKGKKRMTSERAYRLDVEEVMAARELDVLKELLFDLLDSNQVDGFEDTLKFIGMALQVRKERSSTFGLYAPKRKEVTHSGDVELKGIDPQTAQMLEALEREVEKSKAARRGWDGTT